VLATAGILAFVYAAYLSLPECAPPADRHPLQIKPDNTPPAFFLCNRNGAVFSSHYSGPPPLGL
jgi:hypothetical protein